MSPRCIGLCAWAVALSWSSPSAVRAQESPPYAQALVFAAGDPVPRAVLARSSGLVVRVDERDSWELLCSRAVGLSSGMTPQVYVRSDGSFVLGSLFGVQLGDASACSWEPSGAPLDETGVQSLERQDGTLYALSSTNGASGLYRSDDEGTSWQEQVEIPDDAFYRTLLIAPSRPERMYFHVVRSDADSGTVVNAVAVSDDGGATRIEYEIDGDGSFDLLAVDPAEPDRVYASRVYSSEGHSHGEQADVPPDQLLVSEDAGTNWDLVTEVGRFGGLALDGDRIWVGDGEGSLLRSDDRGASFTTVNDAVHVGCLALHEGSLYACGQALADGFSVGVSDDDGETFSPVVSFDEVVSQLQCGDVLDVEASCGVFWSGWQFWHQGESPDAGAMDASPHGMLGAEPAPDAGGMQGGSSGGGDDGCSCRVPGAGSRSGLPSGAGLVLLGLLLGLGVHARRRSRR